MITAEVPKFFHTFEDVISRGTCGIPVYFLRATRQFLVVFLGGWSKSDKRRRKAFPQP